MLKNRSIRLFLASMTATLYLLALATGLIIVEYNTRNIGFGDATPVFAYQQETAQMQLNVLGKQLNLDMSGVKVKFVGLNPLLDMIRDVEKNL